MARISGKNGRLYVGLTATTSAAEECAWLKSADFSAVVSSYEVTAFTDLNKTYVVGLPDASLKFDGFYDTSTAQTYTAAQDGNSRRCYLYPDAVNNVGTYWYGTGFFDFEVTIPVDGPATIQGTMVPAGPFTKVG